MGADVDLNNVDVVNELISWTKWYLDFCNIDGFRLDAVKHIRYDFYKQWLEEVREYSNKDLLIIGEYWKNNVEQLQNYLSEVEDNMSLFDVPLHYNLFIASNSNGDYDMSKILDNTLVKKRSDQAITFVDNHDTQIGQSLESTIQKWFKPLAYALILLRNTGIPCVFYGDYYGINDKPNDELKEKINQMLRVREEYCYGKQNDYFDDSNVIGWTLEGDDEHDNSGIAVIMSDGRGGFKNMYVGTKLANCTFHDITNNITDEIIIDKNGNANFMCNGGSVSIWIKKD